MTKLKFIPIALLSLMSFSSYAFNKDLLIDNSYSLKEINKIEIQNSKKPPYIKFSNKDGIILAHGNGGCNNFRGVVVLLDNQIKIDKMFSTQRACINGNGEIERVLMQNLSSWNEIVSYNNILNFKNNSYLLTFEKEIELD